jgi:DNA helicase IV
MPGDEKTTPDIAEALAAERAYLAAARAELARMRDRTLALDADKAGGSALASEYLKGALYYRAQALIDDPDTPLFFGRLDMSTEPEAGAAADPDETTYYVGRRHVHDDDGDPVVVDWRADVSRAFYRATRTEPMDVVLRRRFGFDRGHITAYEDEHLLAPRESDARTSRILASEIERPRVGPMRDIVATIQPEQDVIVRADVNETVCVQGAPGTGKTAVGLHRAAYLLYAFRDRLRRGGVLIVGPNATFLSYIAAVLPALGEVDVRQVTVDDLVTGVRVRGVDSADVAMLKGDARMATVLHNAVYARLASTPAEALVLNRGSRRWRVPAHELAELVDELTRRDVRYGSGRTMLAQRLAHSLLTKMESAGESPDDRVQDAVARSGPVKAMVNALWPAVDPVRLVFSVLADREALAAAAEGVLTDEEQVLLQWSTPPRAPGSARWSSADAVLIDEARDVVERTPSLGHVVLDEAQDLSPMQLRAVGRRCSTAAATVLGDLAQGTTPWASADWATTLIHLGQPGAAIEVLERGYRVPAVVIDFASRLLPTIAPGVAAPVSVRENRGTLDFVGGDVSSVLASAVRTALGQPGSVGVIVADHSVAGAGRALRAAHIEHDVLGAEEARHRVALVAATLAKGLEFDHVVVVEPDDIVAAEPSRWIGLRRLYVVLTRAVSGLTVVHSRPLPAELGQTVVA